jgi:hypothetical protein
MRSTREGLIRGVDEDDGAVEKELVGVGGFARLASADPEDRISVAVGSPAVRRHTVAVHHDNERGGHARLGGKSVRSGTPGFMRRRLFLSSILMFSGT